MTMRKKGGARLLAANDLSAPTKSFHLETCVRGSRKIAREKRGRDVPKCEKEIGRDLVKRRDSEEHTLICIGLKHNCEFIIFICSTACKNRYTHDLSLSRVKQLKARIKKRNLEEQKREERVEQAKNALWEEHQKQVVSPRSCGTVTTRSSPAASLLLASPSVGAEQYFEQYENLTPYSTPRAFSSTSSLDRLETPSTPSDRTSAGDPINSVSPAPPLSPIFACRETPPVETNSGLFAPPSDSALPAMSITKLTTSLSDVEPTPPTPPPPPPKILFFGAHFWFFWFFFHPGKKKQQPAPEEEVVSLLTAADQHEVVSKRQAQQQIKEIFTSANSMAEDELTEEAFDMFLDTIKQLSEYVDESENAKRRQLAEERRAQRILVVREKQADIVRYRKVTMAELRLRRQRALMRVRLKLADESKERHDLEKQRIKLFELVHLNEKERRARMEQFEREEAERLKMEEEMRRMKELRVQDELARLLERSKQRQEEDRLRAERQSRYRDNLLEDEEPDSASEESEGGDDGVKTRQVAHSWRRKAKRQHNRAKFESMLKKNSKVLYRTLVKELIASSGS
eukprot:sb/3463435/